MTQDQNNSDPLRFSLLIILIAFSLHFPPAVCADEASIAQQLGSTLENECPRDSAPIAGGKAEEATCDTAAAIEIVGLEDALNRGAEDAFTIEGGVPPFTITLNTEGGRGFSLAQIEISIRSNVLKVADDACGGAEIEVTDSCGTPKSFFVRCVDAGEWVYQDGTCCDILGATPSEIFNWAGASGTITVTKRGNRKLEVYFESENALYGNAEDCELACDAINGAPDKYACSQNVTVEQLGLENDEKFPGMENEGVPICVCYGRSRSIIAINASIWPTYGHSACYYYECKD